jgi:shikimate kinase
MGIPAIIQDIILLGPKHSGKTSAGRELAVLTGGVFIDLDERIEVQKGKSPRTLFKESPETFRAAELQALQSLLPFPAGQDGCVQRVIVAGGGIIDNREARELLLTGGAFFLVGLEVSPETAWERISITTAQSGELPPFLNTGNPKETHRQIHERRAAAYRKIAHVTILGEGKPPKATAWEIFKLWKQLTGTDTIQLQGIH